MNLKYLAIDSDIRLAESEAEGWAERGIGMERADNMAQGIEMLASEKYLYIGINDDAVDFLPLLRTMRSATNIPILIATSNFCAKKDIAALRDGADVFAPFHKTNDGNIDSVLAHIFRINDKIEPARKNFIFHDLLISPDLYQVFIKNTEIVLTVK